MIATVKAIGSLFGVAALFAAAQDAAVAAHFPSWLEKGLTLVYPIGAAGIMAVWVTGKRKGADAKSLEQLQKTQDELHENQKKCATKEDVAGLHREIARTREDVRFIMGKLIPDARPPGSA